MAEIEHEPDQPEREQADQATDDAAPLPPWAKPSPEARAEARPAKEALKDALREIKTPEQAERVADEVTAAAGDTTEKEIREHAEASPVPAQAVQAAAATPGAEKAPATLVEAAKQVAGSSGETREALEQAVQKATNPEQQGLTDPTIQEPLSLLREAILHRMKPFQALDARVFLLVNHMPHTPLINRLMYAFTLVMSGGWGWVLGLVVAALIQKRRGRHALLQIVPPLWFATMTVEYPVKYYFRRKRPFIDVVQAVAIGRKPGSYSFPSGHSASAFAGAWLLRRHYPELTPLWYTIAGLTGFSRVYLGVHYPGDVLSGALAGTVLAEATRWVIDEGDEPVDPNPLRRALRRWFG